MSTGSSSAKAGRLREVLLVLLGCAFVSGLVVLPVAAEQAVEHARFEDRLGTLPVEVRLARNGVSTLDTGVLGKLYWNRTGVAGFGASLRATGPPLADGTLASYVTPAFAQANARFVEDPNAVAQVYGDELTSRVLARTGWYTLIGALIGGVVLTGLARGRPPGSERVTSRGKRVLLYGGATCVGMGASALAAAVLLSAWSSNDDVTDAYPMPDVPQLSFSSPQTREIARQVQPFITKNVERIEQRNDRYAAAAEASMRAELALHAEDLRPRDGEVVVIAEADPQGSHIGTRVRTSLYALLEESLGSDALVLRTIAGDVTSNGTVAEKGFVEDEAAASPGVPVVAAKGDHDTETTVEQLEAAGVVVPDLATEEAGGFDVASVRDPDFKALFGGLVVNESGITQQAAGEALRAEVDAETPVFVVLHQPGAAAGYVGGDGLDRLRANERSLTEPVDDGVPDVPPGSLTIGHLHDAEEPWVLWNTDGDTLTWTVVTQLGTSGGVEESPTFNRFSTPFSAPLKTVSVQLQYVNSTSGLQTGYASIEVATDGTASMGDRQDLGLPGGLPVPVADLP